VFFQCTGLESVEKRICFYGVLGNISQSSTVHTVGQKYRVFSGMRFIEITPSGVIDLPEIKQFKLDENIKDRLDKIISDSKNKKSEKSIIQNFSHDSKYYNGSLFDDDDDKDIQNEFKKYYFMDDHLKDRQ
jgi:hypothetical protein